MGDCWQGGKGKLCLRAPLKDMQFYDSDIFSLHEGFPLSNLLGLTRLVLHTLDYREEGTEETVFKGLPLMKCLQLLYLSITRDRLTGDHALPASLREVRLFYWGETAATSRWDSSLVPVLQQLPAVEVIKLQFGMPRTSWNHADRPFGDQELDFPLSPFIKMKSLRILQLGTYRFWKPEAMRQLGMFEAELARSRSKLRFLY